MKIESSADNEVEYYQGSLITINRSHLRVVNCSDRKGGYQTWRLMLDCHYGCCQHCSGSAIEGVVTVTIQEVLADLNKHHRIEPRGFICAHCIHVRETGDRTDCDWARDIDIPSTCWECDGELVAEFKTTYRATIKMQDGPAEFELLHHKPDFNPKDLIKVFCTKCPALMEFGDASETPCMNT